LHRSARRLEGPDWAEILFPAKFIVGTVRKSWLNNNKVFSFTQEDLERSTLIWVWNRVGIASRFLIASLMMFGANLLSRPNPSSQPYVLVVEDEFFSRMHAADLVDAAGYRAIEASNADEALAILDARRDIRIVFTDIDMPGSMDGLKLARAIRRRWPPIELILTSGHIAVPVSEMPERGLFFSKPYRDNEIVSALQKFAA
jgi:CheY-like chemotaxis protein